MSVMTGLTRRGALASLGAGTLAACGERPPAPDYVGKLAFLHGVAAGDPTDTRMILWTRVSPETLGPVPVRWVVARNRALSQVVRTGVVVADAAQDYTVKVDVEGLRAGAAYFYGFLAGDQQSPVGAMRTLAKKGARAVKLAVTSCASYPHGFFNVYEAIAAHEDLDAVVHLGDYIYEYGLGGYGGDVGVALGRIPNPQVECLTLEDYRKRHAQAKLEPELQRAHQACAWIVAWDDHEIANDCWTGGAENHNPERDEGAWESRRNAALQAYFEWMPIREPGVAGARAAINRVYQFGDIATLAMLETRLLARTKPFDYARDTPLYSNPWDFSNPDAPRPLRPHDAHLPNARMVPVPYRKVGRKLAPIFKWDEVSAAIADPAHPPADIQFVPDRPKLAQMLAAPARTLLGAAQEQWLERTLNESVIAGSRWQLIGSQVVMAPLAAPDLSDAPDALVAELERVRPGAGQMLGFTRFPLPLNPDAWDGYPRARERVLAMVREARANAIVLSGDSHAAWANEIFDSEGRTAVEFGAPSVTSPSEAAYFDAAGMKFGERLAARNAHVKWTDQAMHGFVVLTLMADEARADFHGVSSVQSKVYESARAASFKVVRGEAGVGAIEAVAHDDDGDEK